MKNDKRPQIKKSVASGSFGESMGADFRPLEKRIKVKAPVNASPLKRRGPAVKRED
jgi:hypothetical protein